MQHEDLVRKMTEMDVPWELRTANREPSLRMGKAERAHGTGHDKHTMHCIQGFVRLAVLQTPEPQ